MSALNSSPNIVAVKDGTIEREIPSSWRSVLQDVVSAFAKEDYRLKTAIPGVEEVSVETAPHIRNSIRSYGATLIGLPNETWESSVCMWYGTYWADLPSAGRLSQTLGVYGFFPIFCRCKFRRASFPLSSRSAQVARIHEKFGRHGVVSHGRRGLSVPLRWRPAHGSPPVITLPSKPGTSSKRAWTFHASKIAALSHEILAVHAPVSEHFMRLPVSQRLKSQCVVMRTHSNTQPPLSTLSASLKVVRSQPWRPAIEVSASKAKRSVVQQTPNPSFKRTCLRQAA